MIICLSKHKPMYLLLIVSLKKKILLPGINIAIMIERISNSNLCPIDLLNIVTNSDYYFVDFVWPQEVESPPWTQEILCAAAGSMLCVWVRIPINGFVRSANRKHT